MIEKSSIWVEPAAYRTRKQAAKMATRILIAHAENRHKADLSFTEYAAEIEKYLTGPEKVSEE